MYLIDTNIISELRKGKQANHGVIEFLYDTKANKQNCYLSVVTIGELRRGIEMIRHRGDVKQADALQKWFLLIANEYSDKILPIDHEVAAIWADLRVPHHENILDKFIAATALLHSLQVVTGNTKDFEKTGVPVVNPYK
ncbi:MAG: type II toxin-antitoxin system VapC family toxin [Granulosicoccaceae bacterium]